MKHKLVFIIISVSIIALISSCVTQSISNPGPQYTSTSISSTSQPEISAFTPTPSQTSKPASLNATAVLAPISAAMSKVNTVNIDSNIIDQYTMRLQSGTIQTVYIWDGQRAVDIGNNQMHLKMNLDELSNDGLYTGIKVNSYYDNENSYNQSWMSGGLSPQGRWYQSKLREGPLNIVGEVPLPAKNQLSPIIELLASANQTIFRTTGKLDGPSFQVIDFSPSAEAVADWILSLYFEGGPSMQVSTGIDIIGKNTFMKTYKGGIFKIWVDSESNLIIKAYFAPVFQATLNELDSYSRQTGNIESDFIGQLNFSNYNQPVDIQVPPEALNGK